MSIDPRLGLALMALCVLAFVLVERDRQRRIASMSAPRDDLPTPGGDNGHDA